MSILTIFPAAFPGLALTSLTALALALFVSVWSDLRYRQIPNAACIIVAVFALPFWVGMLGWRLDTLWQPLLIFGAGCFILLPMWMMRWLGGGDVKLMAALLLWQDLRTLPVLLLVMIFAGGAIGLLILIMGQARLRWRKLSVPYGVAIALGAVAALGPVVPSLLGRISISDMIC